MKANEVRLALVLQAMAHYIVPLFQRPYSWQLKHWTALWSDLLETRDQNPPGSAIANPHFLGAVVAKAAGSTMGGISSFLLIDGQQRLTTLLIMLAALRDVAKPVNPQLATKIHELYLTNRFTAPPYDQKLLPSQLDRAALEAVVKGSPLASESSHIVEAYRYFSEEIGKLQLQNPLDLEHLEGVIVSGLEIVSITLDGTENEYRIFESLNARGAPLTQADLLRNYFFMRIPPDQQDQIYQECWLPIQQALGETGLADYFRYLIISDGQFIREDDVYQQWKRRLEKLDADALIAELRTLAHAANLYVRIISPDAEPNHIVAEQMRRLNRWGAATTYPFLLNVYRHRDQGHLSDDQLAQLLRTLESYFVRRLLVGVPTNALNRVFVRLWYQLPVGLNRVEGTRAALSEPGRRWPNDRELRDAAKRVPLYLNGRLDQRHFVLEDLERSFGSKEPVNLEDLTIEHILPQTLTSAWRAVLGPEAEEIHQTLLHTLGNITLTGYNSTLSNDPFDRKRQLLEKSHLDLNREVAAEKDWTAVQILARAERLAARAIQLWPGPAAAASFQPPATEDEAGLIQKVLTRIPIPAAQLQLFRALYEVGDEGIIYPRICQRMGRTRPELRGLLGALGNRVNSSIGDGVDAKPGIGLLFTWEQDGDEWRYWLKPVFREAIETLALL